MNIGVRNSDGQILFVGNPQEIEENKKDDHTYYDDVEGVTIKWLGGTYINEVYTPA